MNKVQPHIKKGFSLVEILVALSVFLLFVLSTGGVMSSFSVNSRHVANIEKATALAEEGLEVSRNMRDSAINFASLPNGTYGLSIVGNNWNLIPSLDTSGIFTRILNISTINSNQKKVTAEVSWADQTSGANSVMLETYLTNWQAPLNIGLTIDKSVINHGGTKVPSDFLPVNLTTLVWDNSQDPPVQVSTNIPIVFSPSTMNLTDGTYTFVTSSDPEYSVALSVDCGGGSISLVNNDTKLCSITYEEYTVPVLSTPVHSLVTETTATLGATVISLGNPALISERGICYGTTPNPTTNCVAEGGTTLGVFTEARTGFVANTTYYYRGYAINATGTGYSADGTFTTTSSTAVPTVSSPVSTSITGTSVTLGATVTSLGGPAVLTQRGICYNTTGGPTLTNGATCVNGVLAQTLTAYTVNITGLIPGTTYYFAGYATNATGTGYSADGTFTTLGNPGGVCSTTGIVVATKDQSSGTTNVITKPAGVLQNDLMFIYIGHENATNRLNSVPSGWTLVGSNDNGNANAALYYKLAGASEPATYTFGFNTSVRSGASLNVYRGCFNLSTPVEVISNTPQYTVSNTTYRAASMNLLSTYSNIILFPSVVTSGSRSFSAPLTQGGGWSTDYNFGNASSRFSRSAFSKVMTVSGATGVLDSIGTFSGTIEKNAFAVGLKPL